MNLHSGLRLPMSQWLPACIWKTWRRQQKDQHPSSLSFGWGMWTTSLSSGPWAWLTTSTSISANNTPSSISWRGERWPAPLPWCSCHQGRRKATDLSVFEAHPHRKVHPLPVASPPKDHDRSPEMHEGYSMQHLPSHKDATGNGPP